MALKVGFVGLGIMGRPQAINLIKGGYQVAVYARRAESMQPLKDAGATTCASPKDVAAQCDVIITMVADTPDVEQVLFGEGGIIHGAKPGSVVIDMSTISPVATKTMAERLAAKSIDMIDAPVSGGEVGAVNGTLTIMCGGKQAVFDKVKPILECMGKTITLVGDSGAGQVAKACNQIVVGVSIEAVSEAMALARRMGVDPGKVREALMGGFAGSKIMEIHGKRMLDYDFKPGFKTKLHQKDMKIVMDTASALGLNLPGAALFAQNLDALMESGDGELDSSAVLKVIERASSANPA
ncbi:MAG: 2-hydroxy-3-oxopropionate reductase [Pseudomonadota bacterium]|nr:2-hydroxy-3-oxopropionate reductase [Pseudomonadota bacterium]